MKSLFIFVFVAVLGLFVYELTLPSVPEGKIYISHMGFESCRFNLQYGIDSTFSDAQVSQIEAAAANWILASEKQICFTFYAKDVKWHEYFTFQSDTEGIVHNAQGGVWQQAGIFLNPHCQKIGCVGLAFSSGDIFLSDYHLYLISLHEIGHTLGMSHSPNFFDIMYPYVSATRISQEDKRVLRCLITHKQPFLWGNPDCRYREVKHVEDRKRHRFFRPGEDK